MARPYNVLLITGDHTRHDAVAANYDEAQSSSLGQVIQTPNLDRLAREGVTFTNCYSTDPICVPARASITTGCYPHKCTHRKTNGGRIRDDQVKLAEHFGACGYVAYACGKLHYVPYSPPGEPRLLHGFQKVDLHEEGRVIRQFDPSGKTGGLEDYHDYLKSVGWEGYGRAHGIGNNDVHSAPSPMPAEHHEEAWVARRTIARLEEHMKSDLDKPFLMWSSFAKPHPPYDPPRPWDAMYDPRDMPSVLGGWENEECLSGRDPELQRRRVVYGWDKLSEQAVQVSRAYYCGMMSFQDEMIGRMLSWLDENDLADSTIVIYTADHGDLLGDFGRFFKVSMMDSSVKVPLIWRVPGLVDDSGSVNRRTQLVGLQDILPTLSGLTGCELDREVDGMDITDQIADPQIEGRDFIISQTHDSPQQKYMVRTNRWKYVYHEVDGIEELYDVNRADYELYNLAQAPEMADIKEDLRETLIRWCKENGDDQMLDEDGDLVVTEEAQALPEAEFDPNRMGWRKY